MTLVAAVQMFATAVGTQTRVTGTWNSFFGAHFLQNVTFHAD
jgi:hypothetical protein